jgi:hypothetical protein
MAASIIRWEGRDGADREQLGVAAFNYCRAVRAQGATSCRFFWTGPDSVVVFAEADSPHFFDDQPKPEGAQALFALADVARTDGPERWMDPRDGQAAYRSAGR